MAERPWCEACPVWAAYDGLFTYRHRESVDLHERLRRSQGGDILDETDILCVCRQCHDRIGAEVELSHTLGLTRHSWDDPKSVDGA